MAKETEAFIDRILGEKPDRRRLENRWRTMNLVAWQQQQIQAQAGSDPSLSLMPARVRYLKKFVRKMSKSSKKRLSKLREWHATFTGL